MPADRATEPAASAGLADLETATAGIVEGDTASWSLLWKHWDWSSEHADFSAAQYGRAVGAFYSDESTCSSTLIGEHLLATARHCMMDADRGSTVSVEFGRFFVTPVTTLLSAEHWMWTYRNACIDDRLSELGLTPDDLGIRSVGDYRRLAFATCSFVANGQDRRDLQYWWCESFEPQGAVRPVPPGELWGWVPPDGRPADGRALTGLGVNRLGSNEIGDQILHSNRGKVTRERVDEPLDGGAGLIDPCGPDSAVKVFDAACAAWEVPVGVAALGDGWLATVGVLCAPRDADPDEVLERAVVAFADPHRWVEGVTDVETAVRVGYAGFRGRAALRPGLGVGEAYMSRGTQEALCGDRSSVIRSIDVRLLVAEGGLDRVTGVVALTCGSPQGADASTEFRDLLVGASGPLGREGDGTQELACDRDTEFAGVRVGVGFGGVETLAALCRKVS